MSAGTTAHPDHAAADGSLIADPVRHIHPARLADCLPAGLSDEAVAALGGCRRLAGRLSALIVRRHGLAGPTASLDRPTRRALALAPEALTTTARFAGALWHGAAIRGLILGRAVGDLIEAIGQPAHGFALRHADPAAAPETPSVAELAAAIDRDGLRCLGAWCAAQPDAVRNAMLMKLAPGTAAEEPVEAAFADAGPAAFRRALDEVATDA